MIGTRMPSCGLVMAAMTVKAAMPAEAVAAVPVAPHAAHARREEIAHEMGHHVQEELGILTETLEEAKKSGKRLGHALTQLGFVNDSDLTNFLARLQLEDVAPVAGAQHVATAGNGGDDPLLNQVATVGRPSRAEQAL